MQLVLLSGGSGKRLWPLSNDVRSKQFLKLVRNEDGTTCSMVQRVYSQIQTAGLNADISIATSSTQVESIKKQLGNKVSIIVEPERRNTFPAIALSAAHLYFNKKCSLDETVIVLPVDPYVDNEYFKMFLKLDYAVQDNIADIVLMGINPTYPSEKYGYIIPAETDKLINQVAEFKEKPDIDTAKKFIDEGGLWNAGVFAFKLSYLMDIINNTISCSDYLDVKSQYVCFEKTSFDYAVVEKANSVAVVSYDGQWQDLGTWNTLTEVMDEHPIGNVAISEDCVNTHVINELEIPLVVMGANNMVIAASADGVLVADKEQSAYIKKYVDDIDLCAMFEEFSWGESRVFDIIVNEDGAKTFTKRKKVIKSEYLECQSLNSYSVVWTVIKGNCKIIIDDRIFDAYPGDTYSIATGQNYGLKAITDVEIIEVYIEKMDNCH